MPVWPSSVWTLTSEVSLPLVTPPAVVNPVRSG